MYYTRRQAVLTLGCALVLTSVSSRAEPKSAELPYAVSLRKALDRALHQGQPLVVMVSLHGCAFCKIVRQSHLLPLVRTGVPIVQVNMRSSQSVEDFTGQSTTHDALVRRWNTTIAPTLLFFGLQGLEVAERMEGAYQPDFYGAYLDERLQQARSGLKKTLKR